MWCCSRGRHPFFAGALLSAVSIRYSNFELSVLVLRVTQKAEWFVAL
jgi:hypothetical protein